jgi:hypothetical protein
MKTILLKGGSLSSTYHCTTIGEEFIRKSIDRSVNREYGFVRWYSQLKKLQRYNTQYPNLFPKVLRSGVHNDQPYFDLEYLDGFQDIKTIHGISAGSIVGTIYSLGFDGLRNLSKTHQDMGSAMAFVQTLPKGVYIAMNGRFFHADNVVKNRKTGYFEPIK